MRIAKQIGAYLNKVIEDKQITNYIEPFCGSCWITQEINPNITRIAGDLHKDLIMMWQSLQIGWIPPDSVTEEEYQRLKYEKPSCLRGFVGFGSSFSGKWFGGIARSRTSDRNYTKEAKNTCLKKIRKLQEVYFTNQPYDICVGDTKNACIYCDIPYFGTTFYGGIESFDYDKFYDWARNISKNNYLFISEYVMPSDFEVVLEIPTKTDMSNKEGKKEARIEKLFKYKDGLK